MAGFSLRTAWVAFLLGMTIGAIALGATILPAGSWIRAAAQLGYLAALLLAIFQFVVNFLFHLGTKDEHQSARFRTDAKIWVLFVAGALAPAIVWLVMLQLSVAFGGLA